jgi:hypothetical protein
MPWSLGYFLIKMIRWRCRVQYHAYLPWQLRIGPFALEMWLGVN